MPDFEQRYANYKKRVDTYLGRLVVKPRPKTLYDPMRFVLDGGGKRVRSVLVLVACRSVGGQTRVALPASAAIEVLHNFTLVHDDIMDNASTRRGRSTVHTRWDSNIALLAGDAMVALAYQALLGSPRGMAHELSSLFTEGLLVVCEGQAYDKEFETSRSVTLRQYLDMIEKKTARMISVAAEMGAVLGGATPRQRRALSKYGFLLGRAFQVQDDLLDIAGDERSFGKRIGGDIREGKKTYILLRALERAKGHDKKELMRVFRKETIAWREIPMFREICERTGALEDARLKISRDIRLAQAQLRHLPSTTDRDMLFWFSELLRERST